MTNETTMMTIEQLLKKEVPFTAEDKVAAEAAVKALRSDIKDLKKVVNLARASRGTEQATMSDDQYFKALDELDGLEGKVAALRRRIKDAAIVVVAPIEEISVEEPSVEETSDEETSDEETSDEETSDEETSDEETSDEETSDEETSDEVTDDEIGGEQPPFDLVEFLVEGDDDDDQNGDDDDQNGDDDDQNGDDDDQNGDDDDQNGDDDDQNGDDDDQNGDDDDQNGDDDDQNGDDDDQNGDDDDQNTDNGTPARKSNLPFWVTIGILATLVLALVAMMLIKKPDDPVGDNTGNIGDVGTPGDTNVPDTNVPGDDVVDPAFDMKAFSTGVAEIFKGFNKEEHLYTEESVEKYARDLCETLGADKLVEFSNKYGETKAQEFVATAMLLPEIETMRYIRINGLEYNPNYNLDYTQKFLDANETYLSLTGKNAGGQLTNLKDYDAYKAYRDAIRAKIIEETGDLALLEWYDATNEAYDQMQLEKRDTEEAAKHHKEEVLKLVKSKGVITLLEEQFKAVEGGLTVIDYMTNKYTPEFEIFALSNYPN